MPFADTWRLADRVEGWLTEGQARKLYTLAAETPLDGVIVEIGSYRGRSAIVLSQAAGPDVKVIAIDPHAGSDRGPRELEADAARGDADHVAFTTNLQRAGVAHRVRHVRRFSHDALPEVPSPVHLLYVDGAHRYRPARDDLVEWGDRVTVGGTMVIHDAFNAVGLTLAQFRVLVFGPRFRYIGRERSLAEYRREDLTRSERVSNALRQIAQLGYFARSVGIKIALVVRQPGIARRLGHDGGPWPY